MLFALLDIFLWRTKFFFIILIPISIFLILFAIKIIILKESSIFVSGDLLVGLLKVEYKYNIDLKDVSFVEVQQRDYKFSSRDREKRGRGIETYRIGHKFIEFNYLDGSVKRIHCNDLSRKQINKILEHCKNKKNYY